MGSFSLLRPYYWGDRKWDNYLLDTTEAIKTGNNLQAETLEIAQEQAEELRNQTAALLEIQASLKTGFEEMRAEFHWGFSLLIDRMDRQVELAGEIAAKLEDIHQVVRSPLLNAADELFREGRDRRNKGLDDKALEAFLQSEQKNDVNFFLQLQIGTLFLYSVVDGVIDLPLAERHFLLAARYADAEKNTIPDWNKYCGQAYFHAAVAAYLLGEKEEIAGHPDAMRACLERALRWLVKAVALWPEFLESIYTRAKCHALLGHGQEMRRELEILSDRDRRYFSKATWDKDFDGFRSDVEEVFWGATVSPGPLAQAAQVKVDRATDALEWARRSHPDSMEDLEKLETICRYLRSAGQELRGVDVDLVKMDQQLSEMIQVLGTITDSAFRVGMKVLAVEIANIEQRKARSEATIKPLLDERKGGSWGVGCGSGCLAGFICFIPGIAAVRFLTSHGVTEEGAGDWVQGIGLIVTVIAFIVGYSMSRNDMVGPLDAARGEVRECDRLLSSAKRGTAELQAEMDRCASWRVQATKTA